MYIYFFFPCRTNGSLRLLEHAAGWDWSTTATWKLTFPSLSAHLCHQQDWKDEVQDLTGTERIPAVLWLKVHHRFINFVRQLYKMRGRPGRICLWYTLPFFVSCDAHEGNKMLNWEEEEELRRRRLQFCFVFWGQWRREWMWMIFRHCKLTSRTEDTSLAVAKGLQWFYAQPISSYFSPSEHFTRFVLKSLQILSGFTTVVVEDTFSDMLREIWCSFYLSVSNLSLTPNMERQDGRSATNYTFFFLFFCFAAIFFFLLQSQRPALCLQMQPLYAPLS